MKYELLGHVKISTTIKLAKFLHRFSKLRNSLKQPLYSGPLACPKFNVHANMPPEVCSGLKVGHTC